MSTDYWNWETTSRERPSLFLEMAHAVRHAIKTHGERAARRRRIRADRKLLMSMPNHMLKDIGIRRSEIDYVVNYGREIDKTRTIGRLPG
jgi:uncharacterized protein YjiS (DUF1127 family)